MKINDIIFYRSKAELWGKLLFFLVSIVLHILPVYYLFNAKFDVNIPGKEDVITIVPLENQKIYLPEIKKKITTKPTQELLTNQTASITKKEDELKPDKPQIPVTPSVIAQKKKPPARKKDNNTEITTATIKKTVPKLTLPPPNFDARAYLKPETLEDIFRKIREDKLKQDPAPKNALTVTPFAEGTEGNDIVVDSDGKAYFERKGFDISPWAQKVVAKINKNWYLIAGFATKKNGVVGISITFKKNGTIAEAVIKSSSKNQPLDQSALNAVNMSAPYPKLPARFPGDQLKVYFLFNYNQT